MATSEEIIGAYWKAEFEKYLLSRKYADASFSIGQASAFPTIDYVQEAYGRTIDFISSIPIPADKTESVKERNSYLAMLDKIGLVLFGDLNLPEVQLALIELKVTVTKIRVGLNYRPVLSNLPILIKEIRNALIEAGEFATKAGLRIMIPDKNITGLERLLKEEGFDNLEITEEGGNQYGKTGTA